MRAFSFVLLAAAGCGLCSCYQEGRRPHPEENAYYPSASAVEINKKAVDALKGGRTEESLELINQALESDPKFYLLYGNKAIILSKLGRFTEAAEALKKAIEVKPDFAMAYLFRGFCLEKTGHPEEAGGAYAKAAELYSAAIQKGDTSPETAAHHAVAVFMSRGKTLGMREILHVVDQYPSYVTACRLRDRMADGDRDFFMWWMTDAVAQAD